MCENSHTVLRNDVDAAHKCFAYASCSSQDVKYCMGRLQLQNEMLLSVQVLAHKAGTCQMWWGIQLDIIILRFLQSVTHEPALKTRRTPIETEACALVASLAYRQNWASFSKLALIHDFPLFWCSARIQIWVHVCVLTSMCMRACIRHVIQVHGCMHVPVHVHMCTSTHAEHATTLDAIPVYACDTKAIQ